MAVLKKIRISEISAVDKPAAQHAKALIMKRDGGEPSIVMFAKMQLEGRGTGLERHHYYDALSKRADEIRGPGQSDAQAFTKAITEDEIGKLLYRALKAAPGPEVKPEPPAKPEAPTFIGPAHARLHSMAVDHQRAHSGMTYAAAYSYLYGHRDNVALRNQVRAEHMAATMATAASRV